MSDPIYVVKMSNGDEGEADTIAAVLVAAWTMNQDHDGRSLPISVTRKGVHVMWATAAARHHIEECLTEGQLTEAAS